MNETLTTAEVEYLQALQVERDRTVSAGRAEYLQAWQDWATTVPADMLADMAPSYVRPAWNDRRPTVRVGKADTGPRRTPAAVDPTAAAARAFTAEAADGLALALALVSMLRPLGADDMAAARRALARWNRTAAEAVTAPMLNHDSTPAVDGLAGAYRWTPEAVERTEDGTMVPWAGAQRVTVRNGGRAGARWQAFARRHGWDSIERSEADVARQAGAARVTFRRAAEGMRQALAMVEDGTAATVERPGRGRPASWVNALAFLAGALVVDPGKVAPWVQERAAKLTAEECDRYALIFDSGMVE